ncbi:MAG: bifunctional DNA-formamidopyrimidine glycosylase/DNA-(apurinic or apyrimidinic site) lyase [Thermomicrobiales bacterium]
MPELPEVETIRIGLERQLTGATIFGVDVFDFPGVIEPMTPAQFTAAVAGQQLVRFRRRGKYLLLDLSSNATIIVHLRMTGNLLVTDRDTPPTRFEHLRFNFGDGRQLRFADQRKFGRVQIASRDDVKSLDAKLGIEPLGRGFTAAWLLSALARRTGQIKAVLLDQSLIAGIGNIYADEALFRTRIHPQHAADALQPEQVSGLHRNVRRVLRGSIDRGGTTFSTYRNSAGESGTNQLALQVYGLGRAGAPCPRCGQLLTCIIVAGRSSHLCPRCQQLPVSNGPS